MSYLPAGTRTQLIADRLDGPTGSAWPPAARGSGARPGTRASVNLGCRWCQGWCSCPSAGRRPTCHAGRGGPRRATAGIPGRLAPGSQVVRNPGRPTPATGMTVWWTPPSVPRHWCFQAPGVSR